MNQLMAGPTFRILSVESFDRSRAWAGSCSVTTSNKRVQVNFILDGFSGGWGIGEKLSKS